jgi:hypothetical protein
MARDSDLDKAASGGPSESGSRKENPEPKTETPNLNLRQY